jgi:hypothetical protein
MSLYVDCEIPGIQYRLLQRTNFFLTAVYIPSVIFTTAAASTASNLQLAKVVSDTVRKTVA